jgi:hypothetical protein
LQHFATFYLLLWVALVPTLALFIHRLDKPAKPSRWAETGLVMLYALLFFLFLSIYGSEEVWYPIDKILHYNGNPPFQHRVLLLLPAQALLLLAPSLPYMHAFLFSQMVAVGVTLWAMKRFSALFIRPDLAFVGQFLTLLMWAPTIRYYTCYDIAIIAVYALALYYLFNKRWLPYLVVLTVGTFNHETTLFLIGLSALVLFRQVKLSRLAGFLALQVACYAAVRLLLFTLLPAQRAWEGGKPALNIDLFVNHQLHMVMILGPLVLWYALAAFGLRSVPVALRWCVALLPCLGLMTFMVGQYNDSRQFDAFIPVAVGLMLCALRARSSVAEPQAQPAADYAMAAAT